VAEAKAIEAVGRDGAEHQADDDVRHRHDQAVEQVFLQPVLLDRRAVVPEGRREEQHAGLVEHGTRLQ
jgi:hypothetical protein